MSNDRLQQLRDMLQEEPGDPFLRYAIALELNRDGATEQAILDLERLLRDMPGHIASYYQLAMMLAELGRLQDAVDCCEAGMLQCLVAGDRKARAELAALRENLEDEMP
jgi:tetratricopeptide (TPR) repeat protein